MKSQKPRCLTSPRNRGKASGCLTAVKTGKRFHATGFTLLETLIVVAIIAVLATVLVPTSQSMVLQSLESSARILAADLRLARSQAIQFDTDWSVKFDQANNSYSLVHTGSGTPPALRNPLAPAGTADGVYVVELSRLGGSMTETSGIRLAGGVLKYSRTNVTDVTFGPTGGTSPLRVEDTEIWLTSGQGRETRVVRLTVSWLTGQIWSDRPEMFSPAS